MNIKQLTLLKFLYSKRMVLVPRHDNVGSPVMIDTPHEKINRSTLNSLIRRGLVDSQEESDGYSTSRITPLGCSFITNLGV